VLAVTEVTVFVPIEFQVLTARISLLKFLALINLAVVPYLRSARRLSGLRGGGNAGRAERDRVTGWQATGRPGTGAVTP
jgi:uncharacterized membrane protein (DUF2068 family)